MIVTSSHKRKESQNICVFILYKTSYKYYYFHFIFKKEFNILKRLTPTFNYVYYIHIEVSYTFPLKNTARK
jgi:hypothetical protein